jgi:hypothetical protein
MRPPTHRQSRHGDVLSRCGRAAIVWPDDAARRNFFALSGAPGGRRFWMACAKRALSRHLVQTTSGCACSAFLDPTNPGQDVPVVA